jgi:hypothetical protein
MMNHPRRLIVRSVTLGSTPSLYTSELYIRIRLWAADSTCE